jgi:DNA repair protein RadC
LLEEFRILLLDRRQACIALSNISTGGVAVVWPIPRSSLPQPSRLGHPGIILAHNHPSGNLMPSQADIDLTRRMVQGGKCLETQVLDHLVVTREAYTSMADEGMMPS